MQVPQSLRENYLLTDADFELHSDDGMEGDVDGDFAWEEVDKDAGEQESEGLEEAPLLDSLTVNTADLTGIVSKENSPQKQPKDVETERVLVKKGSPALRDIASQHGLYN
jgi:hypothetical protein